MKYFVLHYVLPFLSLILFALRSKIWHKISCLKTYTLPSNNNHFYFVIHLHTHTHRVIYLTFFEKSLRSTLTFSVQLDNEIDKRMLRAFGIIIIFCLEGNFFLFFCTQIKSTFLSTKMFKRHGNAGLTQENEKKIVLISGTMEKIGSCPVWLLSHTYT